MAARLNLGGVAVDVVFKDIKNIHLSVYPPTGRVRTSAPARLKLDTIRVFAISKLGWIKRQQRKLRGQQRETPREYLDRESHDVWGKRYLLRVLEREAAPMVELKHSRMLLRVRPSTSEDNRQAIVDEWYQFLPSRAPTSRARTWRSSLKAGALASLSRRLANRRCR